MLGDLSAFIENFRYFGFNGSEVLEGVDVFLSSIGGMQQDCSQIALCGLSRGGSARLQAIGRAEGGGGLCSSGGFYLKWGNEGLSLSRREREPRSGG